MRKRPSARLLVTDRQGRLLLFRFRHDDGPLKGKSYWATPGGALDEGESFAEAARRELYEETAIVSDVGHEVAIRRVRFMMPEGDMVDAEERYFLVVTDAEADHSANPDPVERNFITEARWWSLPELERTGDVVFPEDVSDMLRAVLDGRFYQSPSLMSGE